MRLALQLYTRRQRTRRGMHCACIRTTSYYMYTRARTRVYIWRRHRAIAAGVVQCTGVTVAIAIEFEVKQALARHVCELALAMHDAAHATTCASRASWAWYRYTIVVYTTIDILTRARRTRAAKPGQFARRLRMHRDRTHAVPVPTPGTALTPPRTRHMGVRGSNTAHVRTCVLRAPPVKHALLAAHANQDHVVITGRK